MFEDRWASVWSLGDGYLKESQQRQKICFSAICDYLWINRLPKEPRGNFICQKGIDIRKGNDNGLTNEDNFGASVVVIIRTEQLQVWVATDCRVNSSYSGDIHTVGDEAINCVLNMDTITDGAKQITIKSIEPIPSSVIRLAKRLVEMLGAQVDMDLAF